MKTLEYTGGCIPARAVGGDYYDFVELRQVGAVQQFSAGEQEDDITMVIARSLA